MRRQFIYDRLMGRLDRPGLFLLLLASLTAICLTGGVVLLAQHLMHYEPRPYRAPAGLLMLLMSLAQVRRIYHLAQQRASLARSTWSERWLFWRRLLLGALICYLLGLLLGPAPEVGYLFCAALAIWYAVLLTTVPWSTTAGAARPTAPASRSMLQTAAPPAWASLSRLSAQAASPTHRWARLGGLLIFSAACLVVGAELLIRLYALLADDRLPTTYVARQHALPPGSVIGGRLVNRLGYWDDEFRREVRPGVFRIAVLGDDAILSGSVDTNCLERIERSVPGVEVYNFGLCQAGPREYAALLTHQVLKYQPDLVLTFVSVTDDITQALPVPGAFDWHSLRLYQLSARSRPVAAVPGWPVSSAEPESELSPEARLRAWSRDLTICRTPIAEPVSQQWHDALAELDDLTSQCRRRQIPAALVVVPGAFQVNGALCQSLCRQAGCLPAQLDLRLPQRRLADFALDHELQLVDLLPHFESSGELLYERQAPYWNVQGHSLVAEVVGNWLQHCYGGPIAASRQASNR